MCTVSISLLQTRKIDRICRQPIHKEIAELKIKWGNKKCLGKIIAPVDKTELTRERKKMI